jgi:phosphoribosylamine--glycine ligase
MKVLVVGGGGREHALVWKLAQSPRIEKLWCAPGNPGIGQIAENVEIGAEDLDGLLRFARAERPDFTVIGPEAPLVAGIVDRLREEHLLAFGPTKRAAEVEGSKSFTKQLARRAGVPSADFQVFSELKSAERYIQEKGAPLVVKASGLAAGKGVIMAETLDEAMAAVRMCLVDGAFGPAGAEVVIEEKLVGEELSLLALVDGETLALLPTAQDHKRVHDGDKGPNTGGMGAYSPAPVATEAVLDAAVREILIPSVHELAKSGRRYQGVLYAGLMVTAAGPKLLEYNCRFGDPETQPLMMRLKSDLLELLLATSQGRLGEQTVEVDDRPAVCVVLASPGYPGSYAKGKAISGLDAAAAVPDTMVFHAGTAVKGVRVVTAGGRVLGVTALGSDIGQAVERAYQAAGCIQFEDGVHYRKDIAARAMGQRPAPRVRRPRSR